MYFLIKYFIFFYVHVIRTVQLVSIKRHSRTLHFAAKLCYLQAVV